MLVIMRFALSCRVGRHAFSSKDFLPLLRHTATVLALATPSPKALEQLKAEVRRLNSFNPEPYTGTFQPLCPSEPDCGQQPRWAALPRATPGEPCGLALRVRVFGPRV